MRLPNHSIERIWFFLEEHVDSDFVIDTKHDNKVLIEASVIIDGEKLKVSRHFKEDWIIEFSMERLGATAWEKHRLVVPIMKKLKRLL